MVPKSKDRKFLKSIKYQLRLQSIEPKIGLGGHPDPIIRSFYRAISKNLYRKIYFNYRDLIVEVHRLRPDLNETHFVNLWFRAIQYLFRTRHHLQYTHFTYRNWKKYFHFQGQKDLVKVKDVLLTYNTATHVPTRYRSFNTALRLIVANHPQIDLRIGDIGCSLGLGLRACLANGFLSQPDFTDDTPDSQVKNSFAVEINHCSRAIGIDIKVPTVEWVKACNYPSRYDTDGQVIDSAISQLSTIPHTILVKEADILQKSTIKTLTADKPLVAIYSSMAMYELSPHAQQIAHQNIASSLVDGGLFIEFTFVNPHNWFQGIHTSVRTNHHGKLSTPLEWHLWTDSRCTHVTPGKDFKKVTKILINLGDKL